MAWTVSTSICDWSYPEHHRVQPYAVEAVAELDKRGQPYIVEFIPLLRQCEWASCALARARTSSGYPVYILDAALENIQQLGSRTPPRG